MNRLNKHSRTTTENNRIKASLTTNQPWFEQKSVQEISQAYDILKVFDLYDIYLDTITPKVSIIELKNISKLSEAVANPAGLQNRT
jgi:hypothetical protein